MQDSRSAGAGLGTPELDDIPWECIVKHKTWKRLTGLEMLCTVCICISHLEFVYNCIVPRSHYCLGVCVHRGSGLNGASLRVSLWCLPHLPASRLIYQDIENEATPPSHHLSVSL